MVSVKQNIAFLIMLIPFALVSGCRTSIRSDKEPDEVKLTYEGVVNPINSMMEKRAAHTATLLSNGKVLLAGGFVGDGGSLSSVEVFNPVTKSFTLGQNMEAARGTYGHFVAERKGIGCRRIQCKLFEYC